MSCNLQVLANLDSCRLQICDAKVLDIHPIPCNKENAGWLSNPKISRIKQVFYALKM